MFLGALLLVQCSTEKDRWLNRSFHNTTSRYNGYFNATELLKESRAGFLEGHIEDYTKIIPVFVYANEEQSKGLYPAMDTAIKKCAYVIKRHSMPEKKTGKSANEEWCKWIDDNWFLIGQSNFHKRTYDDALKMFDYVEDKYESDPIYFEAQLWSAKSNIELGDYEQAEKFLKKLDKNVNELKVKKSKEKDKEKGEADNKGVKKVNKKFQVNRKKKNGGSKSKKKKSSKKKEPAEFPEKMAKHVHTVYADMHLRKKEYSKAIERIEKALDLKPKKVLRTRLYFILGQIHQKNNNGSEAGKAYAKVIRLNPEYEMAFYAKINTALAGGGNPEELKAELIKMSKDEKNIEYLDQIYYALGDIEFKEGNKDLAVEYFEQSASAESVNTHQKTQTYLRLADIYFVDKKYPKAQAYYDSTASVVPVTHPEYTSIQQKNKTLTKLVENLNIIAFEDSIQAVSQMSEEDQLILVEKMIEKLKQEEERKRQEAIQKQILIAQNAANQAGKGGKFWPFNPQQKQQGFVEFKETWGDRKNEDNWRRQNKGSSGFGTGTEDSTENGQEYTGEKYDPKTYLINIIPDKAGFIASDEKIINALYTLGSLYKDELADFPQSINSYENLMNRYPKASLVPATLYQLYLLGKEYSGANSDKYKNLILTDYPNSEYAKFMSNPNYQKEKLEEQSIQKKKYAAVYKLYKIGNHPEVIKQSNLAIEDSEAVEYKCKYLYLKAMSISKYTPVADNPDVVIAALNDVITNCQGSDLGNQAQGSLDLIKNQNPSISPTDNSQKYIFNSNDKHMFIYVVNTTENANKIKSALSNFNSASFSDQSLKTSGGIIGSNSQLALVKTFNNKQEAMDYYLAFKVNKTAVQEYTQGEYFVISTKNYAALIAAKKVEEYEKFFIKNYAN